MTELDDRPPAAHAAAPEPEPPSAADRAARGRAARKQVPRGAHAAWEPGPGRSSPVEILERQAADRLPELVPLRYGRMLASPFAFFRGGAAIMAADLATTPASGLRVQLCGDAHLANFGGFASPERELVFDLNDFDETAAGPFEWDVKRLAASVAIVGRDIGLAPRSRERAARTTVGAYRDAIRRFAAMGNLDGWYARADAPSLLAEIERRRGAKGRRKLSRRLEAAHAKDSLGAVSKLVRQVDGVPRIVSRPPLIVPVAELVPGAEGEALVVEMRRLLGEYARSLRSDRRHLIESYRYVDMARKVVGVGSVGTRAWVVLLAGRDGDDPLFLQVKEATASVLEPYAGPDPTRNHGQRVVQGQWLMQAASDILLGWLRVTGDGTPDRDFYVRQLWDWKTSADPERMSASALASYGELCGWTLARAHARSGDRVGIAAYLGTSDAFDRAVAAFAEAYAEQNERDHAALARAAKAGTIAVERDA